MKRCFIPTLTILSMLLASPLRADAPTGFVAEDIQTEDPTQFSTGDVAPEESFSTDEALAEEEGTEVQPATEEEGTSVGQASNDGASSAKKRMWRNIGLAVGAVAIAVTALILVSTNDGHRHHDKH